MKKIRISIGLVVFFLLSTLTIFTNQSMAQVKEVKIGVLLPLTGPVANCGMQQKWAQDLAVEEINAGGGVKISGGSIPIKLIYSDIMLKPDLAAREAERLIQDEKVVAISGAYASATTRAAFRVAERMKIPFLINAAITDDFTEIGNDYVFRINGKAKFWVRDQIKFFESIRSQTGRKLERLAMLYENGPYGSSTAENLRIMAKEYGYQIVADDNFQAGANDLTPQLSKAKAANPDVIVSYGYTIDSVLTLRTMDTLDIKAGFLGVGASIIDDSILNLGSLAEGAIGIANWWYDIKKKGPAEVNDRYKKKFGKDLVDYAANAYAGLWVLKEAIEKANSTDPLKIAEAMHSIRITKGPAMILNDDEIYFGKSGQNEITLVGVQIQNGKYVSVWPVELAGGKFKPWWTK